MKTKEKINLTYRKKYNKLTNFDELIITLKDYIDAKIINIKKPVIIGIDGSDCSGKTTIGTQLVSLLKEKHSIAIHHFDDYLNPIAFRQKKGEFSVEAFLYDFFDTESLINSVLSPSFNRKDCGISEPEIIIIEGLFLFRETTFKFFDIKIRIEVSEDIVLERAIKRDVEVFGNRDWVKMHYQKQCIPAQKFYTKNETTLAVVDLIIYSFREWKYGIGIKNP